ncbi:unnamed protein product, partial [Brenthis ino]
MPRVKIDYVVSFSSEDPDNQASNLLAWDISKKKWLCNKGELSCSVVLQLVKAVKIESINIGAHHAALIEVLVGLSEKPNEPFQVLVPNSVLLTPVESRREDGIEKVRSFSGTQLTSDAARRRWDRVRVVCSQPYNKHCKFGLSFIHIFEPEEANKAPAPAPALPSRLLQLETYSSDEEEFRPGELFAQSQSQNSTSTDAQIRQASSQALKNISDTATKLLKTPISKTNTNKDQNRVSNECSNRRKDSLLYNDDDEKPHAKIDHVVQRHNDKKEKESKQTESTKKDNNNGKTNNKKDSSNSNTSLVKDKKLDERKKTPDKKKNSSFDDSSSASQKKRKRSEDNATTLVPGPICTSPGDVLKGVVFALSGYANPRRAALRTAAAALGARYLQDWQPSCTHLICAFPNTPKLRAVRASRSATVAVTGEWVEACARAHRRLPWQWYATEHHLRVDAPADWDKVCEEEQEVDTDDEIEKVLKQQKKKRLKSPSPDTPDTIDITPDIANTSATNPDRDNRSQDNKEQSEDTTDDANVSRDSDIAFVKDERIKANITIFESDSDTEEDTTEIDEDMIEDKELPNFFDGYTFLIDEVLEGGYDRALIERYIRAYGGLVQREDALLDSNAVHYRIGSALRPEWVWRCHRARARVDTQPFEVKT